MDVDLACDIWSLLLSKKCSFLDKWIQFVNGKKERGEILVITKDTWDLFYDLVKQTRGNISNFEDDGAWPSMIDDFVAFMNAQ